MTRVSRNTVLLIMMICVHYCQLSPIEDLINSFLTPSSARSSSCPHDCRCTHMTLATLIHKNVDLIEQDMGSKMRENIAAKTKQMLTGNYLVQLLVNYTHLTEVQCQRSETFFLQSILNESQKRHIALDLTCTNNATLVWDSNSLLPHIYSIKISNCFINATSSIKISSMAWMVYLDKINPSAAALMDFSSAWMLIALSVTNSSMTNIPKSWDQYRFSKLTFINFAGNSLTDYTCSLGSGKNMDTINLNNNALTQIPQCIVLSKELQPVHLSLGSNAIEDISELFDNTNHTVDIQHLNLQRNKIVQLGIFNKSQTNSLDLSWNNINFLPEGVFDNQIFLKWVDLSHNQITYLSQGPFKQQYFLKHVNLSYNRLTDITFDQGPISVRIVDMDLTYNNLKYPPFHDTGYISPRLTRITMAHNPFVCDCKMESFHQFMAELKRTAYKNFVALTNVLHGFEMNNSLVQPYIDINSAQCYKPLRYRTTPILNVNMTVRCPIVDRCPQKCFCYKNKQNLQLVLNCSHATTDSLPLNFPSRETTLTFVVIFDNGVGPETLDYRSYLSSIRELYAVNASIQRITSAAITAMGDIEILYLHDNLLSELPRDVTKMKLKHLKSLTLHGNPWQCNCNTKWFPRWLRDHKQIIKLYNEITCKTVTGITKSIDDISPTDFDCSENSYLPLVVVFTVLIVLLLVSAGIVYKFRLEIRVFLYTRFNWRPFDMFRFEEEGKQFDAFVSFSEKDYKWIVHTLVNKLEGPEYNRKLCVHYRDFPVGAPVAENILWAITNSRCTLLLLTPDFLQSEWCMFEFREAHQALLEAKDNKLIIMLKGGMDHKDADDTIRAYLRTHTYLDVQDKWFWSKLDYVVPVRPAEEDVEQRV